MKGAALSLWSSKSRIALRKKLGAISDSVVFHKELRVDGVIVFQKGEGWKCSVKKRVLFTEDENAVEQKYLADVDHLVREAGMRFRVTNKSYRYTRCCRHIILVEFEVIDPYQHRSF